MSDKPKIAYGPSNPHPLSQMRTELVWEGKYDEFGNRREMNVANLAMPMQRIETIDEPRSRAQAQGSLFDVQRAHIDEFRNRLIWGDNKIAIASLLAEFSGKIDLIYIDPPFDVGADFKLNIEIGDDGEEIEKDQSILEMIAYRDMWGRKTSSYLATMYERIVLCRELLSESGAIVVHCDWRVNSYIRGILDDVFGSDAHVNEIIWRYKTFQGQTRRYFPKKHDTLFLYAKTKNFIFNEVYDTEFEETIDSKRWSKFFNEKNQIVGAKMPTQDSRFMRYLNKWVKKNGRNPNPDEVIFEARGQLVDTVWDMKGLDPISKEKLGYPTQKPEELIERVIKSLSSEESIIADFFCGSGTTMAVAEKLGRKWIGVDLGRFAVHTTRKRLIEVQREAQREQRKYRAFDIYNLGRYERQWWQQEALKGAEDEHRNVVLNFFRAEHLPNAPSPLIHGRKATAFIHVDGIDSIFSREEAKAVAQAVKAAGGKQVHCLAWDFEMDIRQAIAGIETELDVKIRLHRIPREIMEKNRTEVPPFFEVALLEAEPVIRKGPKGKTVEIKLKNFLPSLTEVPSKELEALQERAMTSGFDFIDFWAIDFDWVPGKPFNHHWQDYRTRKDRSLKTVSDAEYAYDNPGKYTACIKVVDVFGCDTSITVEIEI
ncbi:MAG: site-specific DNA-methyltransferase [Hyphomicrobiales bacterium]